MIDHLEDGPVRCHHRETIKLDYPNCPYNKGHPTFSWEEVKKLRRNTNGNNTDNSSL